MADLVVKLALQDKMTRQLRRAGRRVLLLQFRLWLRDLIARAVARG